MSKSIMILGGSILQLPAIKKAKEMGLQVIVVDMNPEAIGFSEVGIEKEVISTIDIPEVIKAAKKHNIDGIMTLASDMPMRTVAAVAKELNLIGISEETALKATDKAEMRKALKKHNVPIPRFYKVTNQLEYCRATKQFQSAFIVKPADNSGSRGIMKVDNIDDKNLLEEAYEYSHEFSRNGNIIIEEYMNGPEVSVETLSVDGVCHVIQITDKLTTGAPHFVEMGHSQPSKLPNEIKKKIKEVTIAANKAIGIENGPSHTEIIVTEEGPKIVEIGARLGGDNITTHLVPLSTGVDMVEACIKIALGEKPDVKVKFSKGSAIRYFNQKEGVIKNIVGIEVARKAKGIKEVSIVHGKGDLIEEITNSISRIGFVIAQGENEKEADNSCKKVLDIIVIEMEEL